MASGSGKGRSTKTKSSTNARKRGSKRSSSENMGHWVADKNGRTGHWEGGSIYDDLPF